MSQHHSKLEDSGAFLQSGVYISVYLRAISLKL